MSKNVLVRSPLERLKPINLDGGQITLRITAKLTGRRCQFIYGNISPYLFFFFVLLDLFRLLLLLILILFECFFVDLCKIVTIIRPLVGLSIFTTSLFKITDHGKLGEVPNLIWLVLRWNVKDDVPLTRRERHRVDLRLRDSQDGLHT